MVKDKRIVDFLSVTLLSFTNMDLASSQNGSVLWLWEEFLFAWLLCFLLFSFSCMQPLKAWCTLRNNLRQNILTRHWKIINSLSSLPFIQSKVRIDSKCLTGDMKIYIQALVSCVRLKMLLCCPPLLWLSIHACGSFRCCVWSICVRNRAEIWKLFFVVNYYKLCLLWDGIRP